MEEEKNYKKELTGFESKDDLLNITSNKQFIISYDINKNLSIYNFETLNQQKLIAKLPKSKLIDIKLQPFGSLLISSFEDGSILLFDAQYPDKFINTYNYYSSIDAKESKKISQSNQTCYFRNLTFVDNTTFISVLQKGTNNQFQEQLFKFSIVKNDNSTYSIKNYCEANQINTTKENGLIGNPLKIFDDSFHISRISSMIIFEESNEKSDNLPQLIGISIKKKNKFLIATVNGFRFEIIQSFTADNSRSSISYRQGSNMINVAFTSYSFHMIFVKSLTIPNEASQKFSINDICMIKLPVIICSNMRSLSFISPDLISIVFTSPGALNTSIYSIKEGRIAGVLPPVLNSNLYLNSRLSVATAFTNDNVVLISKGNAFALKNKEVSELVEEGKFVPSNADEFDKCTAGRSESLYNHYKSLVDQKEDSDKKAELKPPPLKPNSQRSSKIFEFWNNFTSPDNQNLRTKSFGAKKTSSETSIRSKNESKPSSEKLEKTVKFETKTETENMKDNSMAVKDQNPHIGEDFNKSEEEKAENVKDSSDPIQDLQDSMQIDLNQSKEAQEETENAQNNSNPVPKDESINKSEEIEATNIQSDTIPAHNEEIFNKSKEIEASNVQNDSISVHDDESSNKSKEVEPEKVQSDSIPVHNENDFNKSKEIEAANVQNDSIHVHNEESSNESKEETPVNLQSDSISVHSEESISKFKETRKFKEGIDYCISLINQPSNDTNDIKLHAIECLNLYINDELKSPNLDMKKLQEEVIEYSKQLSIVNEWLLKQSVLSVFPPSFAGDVYENIIHDHSNALKCYEIDNRSKTDRNDENIQKMVKIITNYSSTPSVIKWLFSCVRNSNEISFPRLSTFLINSKENCDNIQIIKSILNASSIYSLNSIINALLITFSDKKIDAKNPLFKFIESFIIESISNDKTSINLLSKKSLEYLLSQIFTNDVQNPDNRENLLLSLLSVESKPGFPVNIFPNSAEFSYKLYLNCLSFEFKRAVEKVKENNEEKPDFNIRLFIRYTLSFIRSKSIESEGFDSELESKKKIIFDYICIEYKDVNNEEIKKNIEDVISKNITSLVCIFSLTSSLSLNTIQHDYIQQLFTDVFPIEFTRKIMNEVIDNDDIRLTFLHSLINGGIEKSVEILDIVSTQIIQLVPFIITNSVCKNDIKKFIIIGSHHLQESSNVRNCLTSECFMNVCENHTLFDCCCLLSIINDHNEKIAHYLQQLILSLNSNDFSSNSDFYQQICSLDDDDDDDDDNYKLYYSGIDNDLMSDFESSEETFDFNSSCFFKLISKVKNNSDVVELTSLKIFQSDFKNSWKLFLFLVDAFVNAIKKQTESNESNESYFVDDLISLYHDVCFIMSSNEKNDIDFCEIIRVSRESFSCLSEFLQNKVMVRLIADQVFSPHTMKSIEKNILERPLQQRLILKQACCARCKMPMFIDDIGIYTFECGHAVHDLAFCRRNSQKCPICSDQ